MRLSKEEQKVIVEAFKKVCSTAPFELYLFGSRTDDNKRGGDIGLLVSTSPERKPFFIDAKTQIRKEMFRYLDEQKIDITVAIDQDLKSDIFLKSIAGSKIILYKNRPGPI